MTTLPTLTDKQAARAAGYRQMTTATCPVREAEILAAQRLQFAPLGDAVEVPVVHEGRDKITIWRPKKSTLYREHLKHQLPHGVTRGINRAAHPRN